MAAASTISLKPLQAVQVCHGAPHFCSHFTDDFPVVPDGFPVPATAQVSLQRSRPRRLPGPSDRPGVITTIPSKTTFWSQRAPRCHYNDLVPDDFPVPATAQVSLQRSRPRRLPGPSERPSVITKISSLQASFGSQQPPRCHYNDPVRDDFRVPATAQASLQRSCPRRLPGPNERPRVITTISCRKTFRSRLSGPSDRPGVITTIPSLSGVTLDLRRSTGFFYRIIFQPYQARGRSERLHDLSTEFSSDDFPVPASAQASLQRSRPRRCSGPSERPDLLRRRSGPNERSGLLTTVLS
jgi:hypothetical protein